MLAVEPIPTAVSSGSSGFRFIALSGTDPMVKGLLGLCLEERHWLGKNWSTSGPKSRLKSGFSVTKQAHMMATLISATDQLAMDVRSQVRSAVSVYRAFSHILRRTEIKQALSRIISNYFQMAVTRHVNVLGGKEGDRNKKTEKTHKKPMQNTIKRPTFCGSRIIVGSKVGIGNKKINKSVMMWI